MTTKLRPKIIISTSHLYNIWISLKTHLSKCMLYYKIKDNNNLPQQYMDIEAVYH